MRPDAATLLFKEALDIFPISSTRMRRMSWRNSSSSSIASSTEATRRPNSSPSSSREWTMPRCTFDAQPWTTYVLGQRRRHLIAEECFSTCHTTLPIPPPKLSRSFGWVKLPILKANLLSAAWPTRVDIISPSSDSPLLGIAHPTWAISCHTGNYITARGWKFCPLSRLDSSMTFIFWA